MSGPDTLNSGNTKSPHAPAEFGDGPNSTTSGAAPIATSTNANINSLREKRGMSAKPSLNIRCGGGGTGSGQVGKLLVNELQD